MVWGHGQLSYLLRPNAGPGLYMQKNSCGMVGCGVFTVYLGAGAQQEKKLRTPGLEHLHQKHYSAAAVV